MSGNGQIVAEFAGQVAPTACATPTSCTITVPANSGGPSSVPVTITTGSGTSNALTFTYG
jgi:hypothetical protein